MALRKFQCALFIGLTLLFAVGKAGAAPGTWYLTATTESAPLIFKFFDYYSTPSISRFRTRAVPSHSFPKQAVLATIAQFAQDPSIRESCSFNRAPLRPFRNPNSASILASFFLPT